ncbi:TonB-dependent receptor [Novosphingobium bradum]|uniref:TonB-dependent receptor n=1 Tax=Novosphingobium bradum TaxID=1737444 RepID=A0ABV7IKH4_9SPHN
MKTLSSASLCALAAATATLSPAHAEEMAAPHTHEIVVTGTHAHDRIDLPPATTATVTAATITEQVNAASVEDTLKYAPSLIIRKRHVGDNFAPIATRTSGLGASARSLIYADGVLLSAFLGNNNGNGSPRWTLVTPEEIERVDVTYGPFSAAQPGNSIGTTVTITTRSPDRLEASARLLLNVQDYSLYGTARSLPTRQYAASIGDRFGPLALFAAFTRTDAKSQPISIVTVNGAANPGATTGGFADTSRTGAAIRVVGAGGLEHHVQQTAKLKAALDLGPARLSYLLGLWTDDTNGDVESYLRTAAGAPSYLTAASSTSGFNSSLYTRDARHTAQALTLEGSTPRFDWHLVGTSYHYDHDLQNNPAAANALPAAFAGGAGTIQRQDGTGWVTLDAKAAFRPHGDDSHVISLGAHANRVTLNAVTWNATNWRDDATQGAAASHSRGRTRTLALWAQDQVALTPALTLTLGARHEWWRAWAGSNLNAAVSATPLAQPEKRFSGLSPKAALAWREGPWTLRLSAGQAWRMPTVGELYQQVTVGTQLANPNPALRPERARSAELAVERSDAHGSLRLSLFNEVVDGALISQTGPVPNSVLTASFVQNVAQTRSRGIELAAQRRDLLPGVDLSGSLTYADAIVSRNPGLPASVGRIMPGVPRWKATAVATWRPVEALSLTAAARYASRVWATLDHADVNGFTWQGFGQYFVIDLRAAWRLTPNLEAAIGVDNLNNDKYFLFHPFPQRSVTAELRVKL